MNIFPGKSRHRIYLLGITVSVFIVYFSAINADYLPIDDGGILETIHSGKISISNLFLSGGKEYYRPLAIMSLMGDFYLFGGKIAGYHAGNILLHLCNALLVYLIAMVLFQERINAPFYSFIASLLFALHPINTESVVWISCRPDLLCCLFSLLTLLTVFKSETLSVPILFPVLFVFCLFSFLAKEAAFFLPVIIAFYVFLERKKIGRQKILFSMTAIVFSVFIYLLFRSGMHNAYSLLQTAPPNNTTASSMTAIDAAAAFSFYLRKLIYPFPLNFTIMEIDSTLYLSLLPVFAVAAMFLWKTDLDSRFPLTFLATSLIPPIGATLLLPLWAPYAERYLYLPSVAFSLCTIVVLRRFGKQIPRYFLVTCVFALALPTAIRVRLWTQPLLFWQDASAKAPNFGTARLVLASEYLKAGQYAKAEENLQIAVRLGLPRKALESSVEISKQLDKRTGKTIKIGNPTILPDSFLKQ